MSQQPLFPVTVTQLIPNSSGSRDIRYFAVGDDGHEYAAKEALSSNPSLPAAEYLGYCFAATCHIAVPVSVLLNMPDGSEAFGSRFEGGVVEPNSLMPNIQLDALKACSKELSALLSMDVFLSNDDRHSGNFLIRQGTLTGQWSMIAIDFSRSMWVNGFPNNPAQHTATTGNTAIAIKLMKSLGIWDGARCGIAMSAIAAVTDRQYGLWVSAMPKSWITKDVSASVNWWVSSARAARISDVMSCI